MRHLVKNNREACIRENMVSVAREPLPVTDIVSDTTDTNTNTQKSRKETPNNERFMIYISIYQ